MKKLKLFYNPFSGNKSFKFDLDVCIGIFQEGGYEVHPFRTLHPGDIDTHIATMDPNYDIIVASGGDGTVNIVLNAMMRRGLHIPLGIIPSGTANDFATYLGFKSGEVEDVCRTIVSTKPVDIDLGLVNDSIFFINVCAGGFFTNVSQIVDKDVKNALGSLSYYLKGRGAVAAVQKGAVSHYDKRRCHRGGFVFLYDYEFSRDGWFYEPFPRSIYYGWEV